MEHLTSRRGLCCPQSAEMRENFALPVLSVTAELGVETVKEHAVKQPAPKYLLAKVKPLQ